MFAKYTKIISITAIAIFAIYGSRHELTYWMNTSKSYFKDRCDQTKFTTEQFSIEVLNYKDLPYAHDQENISLNEIFDLDSVPLYNLNDKLIYHPVYIAQYSLRLLDRYITTKDSSYLKRTRLIADKLLGISIYANSSIYFPYSVDYKNHQDKFQKMLAPWYSGMAQGQILSLFVRLYEVTRLEKYLLISNKIFNSFTKLKGDKFQPWVVCVDQENHLWIEEYPSERPCFTLNGMIFGMFGIYDYYRITKNSKAKNILLATLTTVKYNISKYRNQKDVSYYCLGENLKLIDYHNIVSKQLYQLYKITGNKFFLNQASNFEADTAKH